MKAYLKPDIYVLKTFDEPVRTSGIPQFEGDYAQQMPGFWEDRLG